MHPIVKINNLSVLLGDRYVALDDVSVHLPAGKIIGFIGPSGAGKTTLERVIVGRQKVSQGDVEVLGMPAGSAALRSQISYMTQETSIYGDLTVRQNLRYFARMLGVSRKSLRTVTEEVLQTIDMRDHADQLVATLSGGQKQRVSLGVALISEAKLLVLDEPTVGLDPVLREQLWELFRLLSEQGRTLIVSSHVMDEAERCDELLLIRNGKLLAHGTPKALCEKSGTKSVEQSFLKLVGEQA